MNNMKITQYEVHPCVLLNRDGQPVKDGDSTGIDYEQCDENDANIAIWGAYIHRDGIGIEHLKDFETKAEAEEFVRVKLLEQTLEQLKKAVSLKSPSISKILKQERFEAEAEFIDNLTDAYEEYKKYEKVQSVL